MTSSTTLMTFIVRTPPTTRTVALFGSWDNFSRPYAMQRDSRRGREHWRGCHSFQNIICDGNTGSTNGSRHGGLKMGGTYWYYYKLDGDIEFHNSAEPSTTSCPMLPGQLVNVLNVPFHLSSGRPRNTSTSSEIRTMNPADKYLNPRPAPQPKLSRLKTSPVLASQPFSSTGSSGRSPWSARSPDSRQGTSQANGATNLLRLRKARKPSLDHRNRSPSPSGGKVAGLVASIRSFKTPRSESPEGDVIRGRPVELERGLNISLPMMTSREEKSKSPRSEPRNISLERVPESLQQLSRSAAELEAHPSRTTDLALRRHEGLGEVEGPFPVASFQNGRRQRANSRDPSPLRKSMVLTDDHGLGDLIAGLAKQRHQALQTVKETLSAQNTPECPVTAIRFTLNDGASAPKQELGLQKRLPTLPNTPSSAYPPSAEETSPSRRLSVEIAKLQVEAFQSHFSATTASTDSMAPGLQFAPTSHFSKWTDSAITMSPTSDYYSVPRAGTDIGSPTLDECLFQFGSPSLFPDGNPYLEEVQDPQEPSSLPKSNTLSSSTTSSTISSVASNSPALSNFDFMDLDHVSSAVSTAQFEQYPPRLGKRPINIQTYQLPIHEQEPLPMPKMPTSVSRPFLRNLDQVPRINTNARRNDPIQTSLPHSESMQQLVDELSYLSGVIQS